MKVLVEAYGCSLNRGEAEELVSMLTDSGYEVTDVFRNVDASVIFTCGVIETTERKMLKRISELRRNGRRLIVCGCLGDISLQKIKTVAPDAKILAASEHERVMFFLKSERGKIKKNKYAGEPRVAVRNVGCVAILPIATGCRGSCSYCATRFARGTLKSRTSEKIISRAKRLIGEGAVELQMCCQDTAVYGEDSTTDLNELVTSINSLPGDFMIRIGMMNPRSVMRNLDSVFRAYEHEKVFKFMHLPVQTGSDKILTLMKREHTVEDFKFLIKKFKKNHKTGMISTDIIIGFPNETENDFEKSLDLVKEIKPDIVNVTRFSARPRTIAFNLPGKIPGWVAKNRSRKLTKLRFEVSKHNHEAFEGKTVKALATECRRPGTTFLRTVDYRPVVVNKRLAMRKWHNIKITGSVRTHLLGKVI